MQLLTKELKSSLKKESNWQRLKLSNAYKNISKRPTEQSNKFRLLINSGKKERP